ncbi:hypothetical protein L7F22_054391 [Adiantum nelumboides]|nr:hypothetical protein [Adiantum nelumboides]
MSYMFSFGSAAVTWSSKKQPIVALSSIEAEYRGATVAACEQILVFVSLRRPRERGHLPSIYLGSRILGAVLDVQLHFSSYISFHSWKMQSDVWGSVGEQGATSHINGGNFAQSLTTVNGWLRDFLWGKASQVIQSYGFSLSAYGLLFLGAHFVWAFSLMFLFSGRGYMQELIESIVWAHNKLKVAPITQSRALSIIQGHAVGVTHYLLGGIDAVG